VDFPGTARQGMCRAVRDNYRYGFWHASQFAIPDEDPPGNQVTTRVQKVQLLSHRRKRFALMLTPRSIPGEFVSPRILRHAPSCDILVTMRAVTVLDGKAIVGLDSMEKRERMTASRATRSVAILGHRDANLDFTTSCHVRLLSI
jgi:hypothetical protein